MPALPNSLNGTVYNQIQAPYDPELLTDRVDQYYRDRLEIAWQGRHPMKGRSAGPNSILMRTNDYLCLAGDKRILEAEITALRNGGHGDAISRIWLHHETDSLREFELRAARLMRAEDGMLCSSGYCANTGLIQSIARPDGNVYIDMMAHMSLWEGISSARARARPFRHNDVNHLERLLKQHGPGIVIVDALYSTDGDICPIGEVVDVAERFGCVVVVDETHSFGTHGPNGAGLVVAHNLSSRVHFRTVGLSKAVSSRGGIVVCSKRNAEFLRYEALPAIFSTSVLQHEVAGYDAVLDIFKTDQWRQEKLHANHAFLRQNLLELGYNVLNSKSQIISLEAGEVVRTVLLRDALESRGIFGSLFFAPAVPDKRCLIRFTVNCSLTAEQLERIIAVCRDIRNEVRLSDWRSTRRMRSHIRKGERQHNSTDRAAA